jgi:small subunit ribosomal protein S2
MLYTSAIADAVLEGRASGPQVPAGEDEFVELDEEGNPRRRSANRRRAPAQPATGAKRKGASPARRRPVATPLEADADAEEVTAEVAAPGEASIAAGDEAAAGADTAG